MSLERTLSPRLAALCENHAEIQKAVVSANLVNSRDLGAFALDGDVAAQRLMLSEESRAPFANIFAITKTRAEGGDEERMGMMLDVLNAEGEIVMQRPRGDVHRHGFWHRAINVWVVCTKTSRVLIGKRAESKDVDPCKWTCVCGRVPKGELSMNAAAERLDTEFSIDVELDRQLSLAFSMKCPKPIPQGIFRDQQDGALIDVYLARLDEEIPVEKMQIDPRHKQLARYISIDELQLLWDCRDPNYVLPPNAEYSKKLFHYLRVACRSPESRPWRENPVSPRAPAFPQPPLPEVRRPKSLAFA
eukprot:TRINITY_DN44565_c0_g1_i1.p1 TRINITY_DN44565_c0_g1~~TRINITY_DN44565_c0_g1_i1.p1  ORF type:complete len:303 (+),score=53.92 TRINITY_DN44565_c0_g1_i1:120-1028(+)